MTIAMTAKPMDPTDPSRAGGAIRPSAMGKAVHLPVGRIAAAKFALGAGAGLVAGALGAAAAPGYDAAGIVLGTLPVLVGAGLSTGMLWGANRQGRQIFSWATLVMAAGMVRLLVSLALAVGIYYAAEPAAGPFFAAFLVGSLAVLGGETVIVRSALLELSQSSFEVKNTEPT